MQKHCIKHNTVKSLLFAEQQRIIECVPESGASSWLTTLPLKKYNFYLSKQEFKDALYLRHGITLPKLPMTCVCGDSYNVNHALTCARGGFVIIRHNEVGDRTGDLLSTLCKDVELGSTLQPLTEEHFTKNP